MADLKDTKTEENADEKVTALDWFNSNIKSIENQLGQYFSPEGLKQFKRFMKTLCENNFTNIKNRNTGDKDLKISSRMFTRIVDGEGRVNATKFKRFFVNIAKMMKGIEANDEKEANEALVEADKEAFNTEEEGNSFFSTLLELSKFEKNKTTSSNKSATEIENKPKTEKKLGDRLEKLLELSTKAKTAAKDGKSVPANN